jgi:hypothetical protein
MDDDDGVCVFGVTTRRRERTRALF